MSQKLEVIRVLNLTCRWLYWIVLCCIYIVTEHTREFNISVLILWRKKAHIHTYKGRNCSCQIYQWHNFVVVRGIGQFCTKEKKGSTVSANYIIKLLDKFGHFWRIAQFILKSVNNLKFEFYQNFS